ncbi:hypothetical protein AB0R12_02830, partial [Streptomyces niveus]
MLAIRVKTENWQEYERISADRLGELIARIGGVDDQFVTVDRIPDRPLVFIQVARDGAGSYTLEHRDGSADAMFGTELLSACPPENLTKDAAGKPIVCVNPNRDAKTA